ncbi:hypothetical protein HYALB_00007336 [Hymenoscyphus albidus]|uniref:Uncharacterized protein n=1 Tax=Hymenoscyphus albidus TaxID=595503 RepID=A0A9N9Q1Y6_9HELO|nr:hypothetical protein HYALB_00007336 [Hymenoscyphus albidus]
MRVRLTLYISAKPPARLPVTKAGGLGTIHSDTMRYDAIRCDTMRCDARRKLEVGEPSSVDSFGRETNRHVETDFGADQVDLSPIELDAIDRYDGGNGGERSAGYQVCR